ncbi:unnamed protein product [Kuraishia capsulata CBS 1993]|uniref:Dipeptidyl peptidase 3 n=1 Tax=Kuraishia capsulata CBS 1993 TaxID=1382522 RepID=W6MN38_9ASCO|nr:uncharacterized protein KUCA_T00003642001 [Kuraishia capsulata CBS 1993]CDK27663.1 unnamed protein product [Kuraishia capsulata CBS 1993]
MASYLADAKAPIAQLSALKAFNGLTSKEKLYAHHLSVASHWGTRAVLESVSPESAAIYDLILGIHQSIDGKYHEVVAKHLGAEIETQYLEYASQFLSNLGNYKSFGDVKFVPRLSKGDFETLVELTNDETCLQLFEEVKDQLYEIDESKALLGWKDSGHVSAYYPGSGILRKDIELINSAMAKLGLMPENSRIEKKHDGQHILKVASADVANVTGYYPDEFPVEDESGKVLFKVIVEFGDHKREFAKIAEHLTLAKKFVANETQLKMLECYIQSFTTGSMNAHKESQKLWVKDKGPVVESNIGFIETYRDPAGIRGEWEGLVSIVNKEQTAKFQHLVKNAPDFIKLLPWDMAVWEKPVFQAPDFTSLEVLTFAGSGIPAGINIPNYDDVRLNVGFKNVSLGNVLGAKSSSEPVSFIDEQELYEKYRDGSFEVQVGIHELLGHGSGKLLSKEDVVGKEVVGLNGQKVTTYYKEGETWGSVFGSVAGSFEECRAETVAMHLINNRDLLKIFGFTDVEEQDNIIYIGFLQMCRAGLLGLEYWDPKTGKWGQAHMQARYAILQVLLQAGEGLVEIVSVGDDDLRIKLDRSKIATVGAKAIATFLNKLHIYKCSADVVNGVKFYNDITSVDSDFAKYRSTVLKKKLPRRQFIQANTRVNGEGEVEIVEYPETEVGMIQSFVDRAT